jgi:hypothetical protein
MMASDPGKEGFVAVDYSLESAGAQGKGAATIGFTDKVGELDIYEVRVLTAPTSVASISPET